MKEKGIWKKKREDKRISNHREPYLKKVTREQILNGLHYYYHLFFFVSMF